ncbi:MAG TPA: hypothetical protein VFF60_10750 [Candidatus Binatus sp.]|nr:hypothetical protein [Candidatus Binatus sp.]
MIVSVPHVLEDFHYGDLLGIGVPVAAASAIVLAAYAVQIAGIVRIARGQRSGAWLLGIAGAVWCIGALLVHGHDIAFASEGYRNGLVSKLLEVLIIILGGAITIVAAGMIRPLRLRA